jgi:squalene-hopene/tetraprenyl-beta-curcumene cyclase
MSLANTQSLGLGVSMRALKVLFVSLFFASAFAQAHEGVRASDIQAMVSGLQGKIMNDQVDSTYWNMPLTMGTNYISQYYLLLKWLDREDPNLDVTKLKNLILQSQLANGSWYNSADLNLQDGSLDATISNYWALKVMGQSSSSSVMTKAKSFINLHGGVDKATLFMKIVLALFDNYPWARIPKIPVFALNENNPKLINLDNFAQWVRPHFVSIAYLSYRNLRRDLGPSFHLSEIGAEDLSLVSKAVSSSKLRPDSQYKLYPSDIPSLEVLAQKMLDTQQPSGSWGGYTSATFFSVISLYDFKTNIQPHSAFSSATKLDQSIEKSFQFIDKYYFLEVQSSAYKGTVCDGRYWDSILLLGSLLKTGVSPETLIPAADFLVQNQTAGGGIPFGLDFEYAPDTDDTAEMVSSLSLMPGTRYKKSIQRAMSWLASMQSSGGGWGAFDRNNDGNPILSLFAAPFSDSATVFDYSTVDVTGHILEAFGESHLATSYPEAVERGIQFIKRKQEKSGAWNGRWGVNYIYGTSAAVIGLVKVGEDPRQPYIAKSLNWLEARQNADGGFGETTQSYHHSGLAGVGISTPSQTAWAISALVEGGRAHSDVVAKAIGYLQASFAKEGDLYDHSVVGTGHPGIVYLNYPSYPHAFGLNALGRYLAH